MAYSQHIWSENRAWNDATIIEGHPVAYVALAKHANYYGPSDSEDDRTVSIVQDQISDHGKWLYPSALSEYAESCADLLPQDPTPCVYELHLIDDETPWVTYAGKWGGSSKKIEGPDSRLRWNAPHAWSQFRTDSVKYAFDQIGGDQRSFALDWKISDPEIKAGKSFTLSIRMHGHRQAGRRTRRHIGFFPVADAIRADQGTAIRRR